MALSITCADDLLDRTKRVTVPRSATVTRQFYGAWCAGTEARRMPNGVTSKLSGLL
jgi:hypothetical protein